MTPAIAASELHHTLPSRPPAAQTARPNDYPCTGLSLSRVAQMAVLAVGMILLNKAGIPGNLVFFTIVIALMISTPLRAVMGMNLTMLGLVANVAFVPKTPIWTLARFANLFLITGRFAFVGGGRWIQSAPYLWMTAFCVVAAVCSIASGYYVHIALLKLVSFWLAMTGFFAALHAIRARRIDTTEWFVAQTVAVCGLCILSLVLGVGANFKQFASQRGLYNLGMLHSQTMGPAAAFMITYCMCVYLFSGHRNRWICLPIVGFLAYCVYLTGSRTALGIAVLGVATAVAAAFAWGRARWRRPRLNLSRSTILAVGVLATIGIVLADVGTRGRISRRFAGFAAKQAGEAEGFSIQDTIASREGLVKATWQSFLESPIFGIGFQVAKTDHFVQNATLFTAPIEKGFLPTAILEEVGVVGTTVFVGFILSLFLQLRRERNIPGMAMFVSHLASNLGEAAYFAVAGQGGFAWMMVIAAILLGDRCMAPPPVPKTNRGMPRQPADGIPVA